jgi:glycosyltransferase involved in cell wall biosynthesis
MDEAGGGPSVGGGVSFMRILTVHNYYQLAGGEDVVFDLERRLLEARGQDVTVFTDHNERLKGLSRPKAALQAIWSRHSAQEIKEILTSRRIEVAHFHNVFLAISPSVFWMCKEHGVPVVQTVHNYRLLCPNAVLYRKEKVCEECVGMPMAWKGIVRRCYRGSYSETGLAAGIVSFHRLIKTWKKAVDVYVALSEFSRQKLIKGGLPEEKIVVKPNFVHPDPGEKNGSGDFVLFVGTLMGHKGVNTLIEAWRRLSHIPLKIVGGGPLKENVEAFVKKHGLSKVEILGQQNRDKVLEMMKSAGFLVFPSGWFEGFPMTIVEAMACGLPVVASRLGVMEELIEDGRTGLHFTPGKPEDLAGVVEKLWADDTMCRRMGKEGRREFEEKYTADKNYQMLMKIYEDARQHAASSG